MKAAGGWSAAAVAASGLALLGCGGPYGGGTPAEQVRMWAASTAFGQTLASLRGDLAHIVVPGAAAATRTACDVLVTDSLAANEQLPTPDDALTSALSRAYATAGAAGHDCYRGADGNEALLARARGERTEALAGLVRAEARYDALVSALPGSGS